ncbi:MAG: hypothetical protein KDA65_05160 [Planctomycetaceae bacterium]|nr:hypothetical protein [Planctomycetaceae bacterium]
MLQAEYHDRSLALRKEGSRSYWGILVSCAFAGIVLTGCASDETSNQSASTSTNAASSGDSTQDSGTDQGPAESLRELTSRFRTEPKLVWDSLPASFQNSLQEQHELFAKRISPDAWEQIVRLLNQFALLFEKHGGQILAAQNDKPLPFLGEMNQAQLDYLQGLLKTLSSPPFESVDGLQQKPLNELWLTLAPQLFDSNAQAVFVGDPSLTPPGEPPTPILLDYFERLSQIDVSLVSRDGDRAVLKLVDPQVPDEPTELEFVRFEGKWVPASWKENWSLWMGRLKLTLDDFANYLNGFALVQTKQLQELEDRLIALNQIEEEAEFKLAWESAVQELEERFPRVSGFSATSNINADAPEEPARKPLSEIDLQSEATIIINRALTKEEQEKVSPLILDLCEYPEVALILFSYKDERETRFRLMPVPNLQSVANGVQFGEVQKIDTEQRKIWIELPETFPAEGDASSEVSQ